MSRPFGTTFGDLVCPPVATGRGRKRLAPALFNDIFLHLHGGDIRRRLGPAGHAPTADRSRRDSA
jgi:hypothetical protein